MASVYGLRLPRHVEAFWAFFTGLSPSERAAFDDLVGFRPADILLRDALDALANDDRRARADDEAGALLPYEARRAVPPIVCGVGVVGPGGAAVALPYLAAGLDEVFFPSAELPAKVLAWVDAARAALDRGEPLFALGLGRDLHWQDSDEFRAESLELMARAYRALGRDALAAIVEVHHAHRDLPSVDIYRPAET